jgi:hypothetical protein
MTKAITKSSIIYRGASLIDGQPIVVVAVVSSKNKKTGDMVQTYILNDNGATPCENSKTGADYSICGNCPHRGQATDDPKAKQAKNRSCYVVISQGATIVYKGVQKGIYPDAFGHDAIATIGRGRMVRLGTYGDPSAVPSYVFESLIADAIGHTAYTHQNDIKSADVRADLYMISADTIKQARDAWRNGQRTFRVIDSINDLSKGDEILCPASNEMNNRTTCAQCKLCGGASVKARNIAIVAHGAGARNFASNIQ